MRRRNENRQTWKRSTAAAMALALGLTFLPQTSLAASKSYSRTDILSHGLTFYQEKTLDGTRGGQTYIYDYTPGEKTGVMVAYGDELYGKSTVNKVVGYAEKQGYTVMAAFNGDFFSMSSGIPTGLVVREGRLVSSDGSWNAVGFRQDGSVIVGAPKLDITFAVNGGQRFRVAGLNKVRDGSGAFLYSGDYSTNTHLSAEGPSVLLRKVDSDDQLTIGGSIALEVVEAGMVKGSTKLDSDTFVLTHQTTTDIGIDLTALQPG
ncbi:MAG: phosphodiester glycosidase family protein, partial [Clostridia bacterium]|nr:phosphodiester glycosidase family protein [Clostridia bacterium]